MHNNKIGNKTTTKQQQNNTDNNDNNIYINLFNKYKERIEKENANKKISLITECQNSSEYALLTNEEQDKLFYELMSIDKKFK